MSDRQDRRTFLKQSAVAASALAVGCGAERAGGRPRETLSAGTLRAAAHVVLPSELGAGGIDRVVSGFEAWADEYEPVAEQIHGYGSQEITYTPPDPRPGWQAQLEALDAESRARHRAAFADLDPDRRRGLIESALAGSEDGLAGRPGALASSHVVHGLLSYYYGGPDATDLCYRRRIGGLSCRPLASSGEAPRQLPVESAVRLDPRRSRPERAASERPGAGGSATAGRVAVSPRVVPGLEPGS